MLNKKTIIITFIVIFVILVAAFIIMKVRERNQLNKNLAFQETNPNNPVKSPSGSKPNIISATHVTTPSVNKILYSSLSQTGSLPLSKGQKSKAVYLLQYVLNALFNAGLVLDGDFGSKTQTALIQNTGRTVADGDLIIALNSEMQKNKSKIKNFNFYSTNGGTIFRGSLNI